MKKVAVLGCAGMAGHVVTGYLNSLKKYDVVGIARSKGKNVTRVLDVTDFDALECFLKETKPDYVVNCVGALVNTSKNDITTAILLNSYLPHYLSNLGLTLSFKLVHISTDCVFSGKTGGYQEDSFRDGDDNYARTKVLGEVFNEKDLTVRTSIIGPELKQNGTGLMDWFLKQSSDISGYSNAYWSGVTTLELAKAIDQFIEQNICGLFQLCPDEKISKYDLLKHFSVVWKKVITINEDASYHVDKSLISTRKDFDYSVPNYQIMLEELHKWMADNSNNYGHYVN